MISISSIRAGNAMSIIDCLFFFNWGKATLAERFKALES
jgi:hypothetical protein